MVSEIIVFFGLVGFRGALNNQEMVGTRLPAIRFGLNRYGFKYFSSLIDLAWFQDRFLNRKIRRPLGLSRCETTFVFSNLQPYVIRLREEALASSPLGIIFKLFQYTVLLLQHFFLNFAILLYKTNVFMFPCYCMLGKYKHRMLKNPHPQFLRGARAGPRHALKKATEK